MLIDTRRPLAAVTVAAAAMTLSACSGTEPGTALPGSSSPGSFPSGSASSAAPSSGPSGRNTSKVDPCSYLPAEQARTLGVQPGVPGASTSTSAGCDYEGSPAFSVAYFYARPYQDKLTSVRPVTINGGAHPAVQGYFDDSGSGCAVSMKLTETTSVEIIAENSGLSQAQDCQVAKLAAQAVEPNLPQG